MKYFSNVEIAQKVFSIIYGKGIVVFILPKEHRVDGFYIFGVRYAKKNIVYYTEEGFPNWSNKESACQTVFYKKDINFKDVDTQENSKVLSEKQILKYQDKGILEIQCPSGIWKNVDEVPESLVQKAFKKSKFDLFRKEKS